MPLVLRGEVVPAYDQAVGRASAGEESGEALSCAVEICEMAARAEFVMSLLLYRVVVMPRLLDPDDATADH